MYVVDHRRLYREGLVTLLSAHGEDLSITEAETVGEAVSRLANSSDDAVVLLSGERDASGHCPRMDDEQQVNTVSPETPVLLICACEETSCMRDCVNKGAKGFVTPDTNGKTLAEAVHFVRAGGTFMPLDSLSTDQTSDQDAPEDGPSPLLLLTAKERRVVELLCLGKSNMEIADLLDQSQNTVKSHVNRILKKLNVKSRTQAVLLALPYISTDETTRHAEDT